MNRRDMLKSSLAVLLAPSIGSSNVIKPKVAEIMNVFYLEENGKFGTEIFMKFYNGSIYMCRSGLLHHTNESDLCCVRQMIKIGPNSIGLDRRYFSFLELVTLKFRYNFFQSHPTISDPEAHDIVRWIKEHETFMRQQSLDFMIKLSDDRVREYNEHR